jgi:hypothetical protein
VRFRRFIPNPVKDEEFRKSYDLWCGTGEEGPFHSVDIQSGRTPGTSRCVHTPLRSDCRQALGRRIRKTTKCECVRRDVSWRGLPSCLKTHCQAVSDSLFHPGALPAAESVTVGGGMRSERAISAALLRDVHVGLQLDYQYPLPTRDARDLDLHARFPITVAVTSATRNHFPPLPATSNQGPQASVTVA